METPIIFPSFVTHADMWELLSSSKECGTPDEIVSAGFITFYTDEQQGGPEVVAFGKSDSLKIVSRPEDTELIQAFLIGR